jgi:hypothetical protein
MNTFDTLLAGDLKPAFPTEQDSLCLNVSASQEGNDTRQDPQRQR